MEGDGGGGKFRCKKIRWMRRSVAGRAPARQKVRWVEVVDDGQTTQSSQR